MERMHLLGISATVSSRSVAEIATFLGGSAYEASFRPVVLQQFVARGNAIFKINEGGTVENTPTRVVKVDNRTAAKAKRMEFGVDVAPVAAELIGTGPDAIPTLVFCGTKRDCQSMALALAQVCSFDV
jgi:replicative superfamily II helicase